MKNSEEIKQKFLDSLTIDSPCPKDWNEMSGDDKSRYCEVCNKHVFNIISMSLDQSCDLLANSDGSICLRVAVDREGHVVTKAIESSELERSVPMFYKVVASILALFGVTIPVNAQYLLTDPELRNSTTLNVSEFGEEENNAVGGSYSFVDRLKVLKIVPVVKPPKVIGPQPRNDLLFTVGSGSTVPENYVEPPVWDAPKLPGHQVNPARPLSNPERL
jgi:hypothetical protein